MNGCRAWHFPQAEDGSYAGSYPAESAQAIAHLESLRAKGANFLLIPKPAFWWLQHYAEFKTMLDNRYQFTTSGVDSCVIYDLGGEHG